MSPHASLSLNRWRWLEHGSLGGGASELPALAGKGASTAALDRLLALTNTSGHPTMSQSRSVAMRSRGVSGNTDSLRAKDVFR
jgi:hypothetical protein